LSAAADAMPMLLDKKKKIDIHVTIAGKMVQEF
jgi:hypothetical protein